MIKNYLMLAFLIGYVPIWFYAQHVEHDSMQVKIDAANKKYIDIKQQQQDIIDEKTKTFTANYDGINNRLNDALERLRQSNRTNRMSKTRAANCQGATGTELSTTDAGILERLAARADKIREGLRLCYAYADSLQIGYDKPFSLLKR